MSNKTHGGSKIRSCRKTQKKKIEHLYYLKNKVILLLSPPIIKRNMSVHET